MLEVLTERKIVAILRGIPVATADQTVEALAAGGIWLLEVTMNTEGALDMVTRWRENYDGRLRVGAGTVLDLDMAREAIAAGAEFLIAPNLDEAVVAYGLEHGVEVWPGVMTPTEVVRAQQVGATAVKLFPAGSLGPHYLKDLRAPLGNVPMIAVGGVNLMNVQDFLQAGAMAVGLGSNLVDKTLIQTEQFEELTVLAKRYVAAVHGGASP
jgi:2-dehydro-3-deoxyphosphogluconate aldolase/(4S)-4-hydroxy-2-oxoglutarate aldolase